MPVMMYKGIPYGEGTNTLDGLKDVDISNPSAGDVVKYNSSTGKFENGQMLLSALSDIDLTNLQDGQIIKWDATAGKFVNADDSGNVQSDWNENDPASGAYILNKPTIPESATVIPGTLRAGSTSITFTDAKLTDGSRNNIYTSNGVGPLYFDDSVDGVLTLYFEAQDANVGVEVVVE